MTKYRTSDKCGIALTVLLGDAMDRAPRPYTASELAEIADVPLTVAVAFLRCNVIADHVSRRDITRDDPHREGGKPLREYWRGDRTVGFTFGEVDFLDEMTGRRLEKGERPVSWKDRTKTVWSVDEMGMVSAMRGNNVTRLGRAEKVERNGAEYAIRIKGGPTLKFEKEGKE